MISYHVNMLGLGDIRLYRIYKVKPFPPSLLFLLTTTQTKIRHSTYITMTTLNLTRYVYIINIDSLLTSSQVYKLPCLARSLHIHMLIRYINVS